MVMCVVVALSANGRKTIATSLNSLGMEVTLLSSLEELPTVLKLTPVSGILIEAMISTEADGQGSESIQELIDLYPFATFRVVGREILVLGKAPTLGGFAEQCRKFKARVIRREARTTTYMAVYLSPDPSFEDAEKVVTVNVSEGGCFVYSARNWRVGARVWLRLMGNDMAISGTVSSWQAWGNNKYVPGIGIKFDNQDAPFDWTPDASSGVYQYSGEGIFASVPMFPID